MAIPIDNLIEYYRDRYELVELIDHLNIPFDDFVIFLMEWIEENPSAVQEDIDYLTEFADD